MNSVRPHRQLVQSLAAIGVDASQPQRTNLAGLCQALAFSADCHLATLALGLPFAGQREHLIQRVRRFLKNGAVHLLAFCRPMVWHIMAQWPDREGTLVMDRTDLENRLSILTLGAAYCKRVLPLAWKVRVFGASSAARQLALLRRVQPELPPARINFYADAEFRSVDVQGYCRAQHWHWQPLRSLGLQPGERRYQHAIYLNQQRPFGPVNLLADWALAQEAPRDWALDLAADAQAWRRGRKRYWIEPTFRDWKSYGFDLETSKLADLERLDVLLLGIALTTVWMIHVGNWLVRSGRRQELAPPDKADYSLFRLGRDYLQRARTLAQRIPVGSRLGRRPEPRGGPATGRPQAGLTPPPLLHKERNPGAAHRRLGGQRSEIQPSDQPLSQPRHRRPEPGGPASTTTVVFRSGRPRSLQPLRSRPAATEFSLRRQASQPLPRF